MMLASKLRRYASTNLIVVCVLVALLCLMVIGGSAAFIVYNMPSQQQASGEPTIKPPPELAGNPPPSDSKPPAQAAGPQVGQPAPEISGQDADGKAFKLSDYRGKVVVLDFWAGWCGPCMALVPHNKEIVKKMEGKPFVFLGVNLDNSKDAAKKVEADNQINWRSFFDGRGGPIGKEWAIQFIPTVWVIDHKGILRENNPRGPQLDAAIEKLVAEIAADPKSGGSTGN